MKKIFILLFSIITVLTARSQSYTWTNAALDNDFENPANWNPVPLFGYPSFGETAVFDGSVSNGNCIMPFDEDFTTLSMLSNYTGTVDASGVILTLVSISLQGGTLSSPSSTLHVSGNLVKGAGATFATTASSWLDYNLTSTTGRTIVGNFPFKNLEVTTTGTGNRTLNFGASTATATNLFFTGGSNPMAYRGAINVTDMLTISGTTNVAAPSNTGAIIFVGATTKTITGNASAVNNPIGSIRFNTSGGLVMSGNINVTGSWSVTTIGGAFTAGTSAVNMLGGTITAGNTASTQAYFDNLTTTTGSTTIWSNNSYINISGNLTNNGSITANTALLRFGGSGAQSVTGTALSLNAIDVNNTGTKTLGTPVNLLDSLKISAAGVLASGGNLTIKSTSGLKGRIAQIAAGGSITGNVTVETFALGGNTGWALLGSGGVSGMTMNDWYDDFPMAIEGSATDVTSAGGYFESVQGWNEADAYGYDTTITIATPLTPGKGFWTYLGTGASVTSDIVMDLVGSPVTGGVPIPLTNSAQTGTCLIANPYASPIRWTLLRNGNLQVTNAIYIYNADGPYATFVNGVGTNGGSDFIPAGQGFYVEALSNTSLNAAESNKVSSNTQLMKTNNVTTSNGLPIKLQISGFSGDYDETAIRFHGSATNAYDIEWDARKIFQTPGYVGYPGGYSKYTTISTKGGNLDYSINSLPYALTQNAVIPVLVKVMASGQYTINGFDMQLLPPNACVTLKDKLLNVVHNIKASPYVCTINDTTATARFELTVCADLTTGVNDNNAVVMNDQSVMVKHDVNGIYVDLNFDKTTKASVSVTNILGQKIVENKMLTTQNETVHFGLEAKNQLLFVTVETESSKVTKKIIH
ncbi:MAG: hypothetical protein H0U95_06945 [Bacteroidetes bacterium]|nr:hypothetical protein [Bacteroidota bacterium]